MLRRTRCCLAFVLAVTPIGPANAAMTLLESLAGKQAEVPSAADLQVADKFIREGLAARERMHENLPIATMGMGATRTITKAGRTRRAALANSISTTSGRSSQGSNRFGTARMP